MSTLKEYISSLCLGLSLILFVSPVVLYWFIHGSYERYVWITSGPYPFSQLGGGPFQLWVYVSLLIVAALCFLMYVFLARSRRSGPKKRKSQ